jgi:hypothetical protein
MPAQEAEKSSEMNDLWLVGGRLVRVSRLNDGQSPWMAVWCAAHQEVAALTLVAEGSR